ncbi:MAG: hypothetical protein WAM28_05155 [Chlamydiales bacterium]
MKLRDIFDQRQKGWLVWNGETFVIEEKKPKIADSNRETLARVYDVCVKEIEERGLDFDKASRFVRSFWIEEVKPKRPKGLPRIVGEDGFLRFYALGLPLSTDLFRRIWKRVGEPLEEKTIELNPIQVQWNPRAAQFYDVDATPPGLFPKIFISSRLKKDKELLQKVKHDLCLLKEEEKRVQRKFLSLALLSHGAAYREIDGLEIEVPSFHDKGVLISYRCHQHLIAEGVKTVSLTPSDPNIPGIYLCQGTEIWPSQPSVLGSILSNLATHGSATEAYAHSWRRIHKHLRDLRVKDGPKPFVAGHSMGGALAMQIGLYSHDLIQKAYAFNPPMPNERDYSFYHQMARELQENIRVVANLDDFAFWRIGAKVIGRVTLFLGKKRWRYYPVSLWDCLLIFPACIKFVLNVHRAFPAHQSIKALYANYLSVSLTQEEIERENQERTTRFDNLHFLPKLYDPMSSLIQFIRKIFGWGLSKQYLHNQIEIIALHERDLIDTMSEKNREEIERELKELALQKKQLQEQLFHKKG